MTLTKRHVTRYNKKLCHRAQNGNMKMFRSLDSSDFGILKVYFHYRTGRVIVVSDYFRGSKFINMLTKRKGLRYMSVCDFVRYTHIVNDTTFIYNSTFAT